LARSEGGGARAKVPRVSIEITELRSDRRFAMPRTSVGAWVATLAGQRIRDWRADQERGQRRTLQAGGVARGVGGVGWRRSAQ